MILLALALQIQNPPPLPATVASKADVTDAIAAAMPAPCTAPLPDTLDGGAGVAPVCMKRADETRPSAVQAKVTVTAADATWTTTFDRAFPTPPSYVDARVYGQAQPYLCTVTTITATGASGKCYQLVATTLPTLSTSLLGLLVSPVSSAAAGISVRIAAKQ